MLDPEFVADCPYEPAEIVFDEILEVDREAGQLAARMPTKGRPVGEASRIEGSLFDMKSTGR